MANNSGYSDLYKKWAEQEKKRKEEEDRKAQQQTTQNRVDEVNRIMSNPITGAEQQKLNVLLNQLTRKGGGQAPVIGTAQSSDIRQIADLQRQYHDYMAEINNMKTTGGYSGRLRPAGGYEQIQQNNYGLYQQIMKQQEQSRLDNTPGALANREKELQAQLDAERNAQRQKQMAARQGTAGSSGYLSGNTTNGALPYAAAQSGADGIERNSIGDIQQELNRVQQKRWTVDRQNRYNDYAQDPMFSQMATYQNRSISDPMYKIIFNPEQYKGVASSGSDPMNAIAAGNPAAIAEQMTDGEKRMYVYIRNTQGKEAADDYIEYVKYNVNARLNQSFAEISYEMGNNSYLGGAAASLLSSPLNVLGGGGGLMSAAAQKLGNTVRGEQKPIDYNNPLFRYNTMASNIRGGMSQQITDDTGGVIHLDEKKNPILASLLNGKGWADLYQLGMSILDSRMLALISAPTLQALGVANSTAASKIGEWAASSVLGGSAGTQGMLDAVARGASDEQALAMGFLNAAAETVFEQFSLETFINPTPGPGLKRFFINDFKTRFTEGSEEFFTSIANMISDEKVMGAMSEVAQKAQSYVESGMSEDEAKRKAWEEWGVQLLWDFIGGMLMGGGTGFFSELSGNRSYGKAVKSGDINLDLLKQYGQSEFGSDSNAAKAINALKDNSGAYKLGKAARFAEFELAQSMDADGGDAENSQSITNRQYEKYQALLDKYAPAAERGREAYEARSMQNLATALKRAEQESRTDQAEAEAPATTRGATDAKLELTKVGEAGQKAVQSIYKQSNGETRFAEYADEFSAYYNAGLTGADMKSVKVENSLLSDQQQKAIYDAGRKDANRSMSGEVKAAKLQFNRADAGLDYSSVTKDSNVSRSDLRVLDRASKSLGIRVRMADLAAGQNGYIDSDGTVVISNKASKPLMVVAAHEFTHRMQDVSPKAYREFRDFVAQAIEKDSIHGLQGYIQDTIDDYSKAGVPLDKEGALDEIAANYAMQMMEDGKLYSSIVAQNLSLGGKMLNWLKSLIAKVRNALTGNDISPEQRKMYGTSLASLEQAAKLWGKAYNEAVKASEKLKTVTAEDLKSISEGKPESEHRLSIDTQAEAIGLRYVKGENGETQLYDRDGSYHEQQRINITKMDASYLFKSQVAEQQSTSRINADGTPYTGFHTATRMNDTAKTSEISDRVIQRIESGEAVEKPKKGRKKAAPKSGRKYSLSGASIPTMRDLEAKGSISVIDVSERIQFSNLKDRRDAIISSADERIKTPYPNRDTNSLIFLTKKTFTHSFTKNSPEMIVAMEKIGDIIESAVLTNKELPTHKDMNTTVYKFFAAVWNGRDVVPFKLTVKEYDAKASYPPANIVEYFKSIGSDVVDYASVYDGKVLELEAVEEYENGTPSLAAGGENPDLHDPGVPSDISLIDLLRKVNTHSQKDIPQLFAVAGTGRASLATSTDTAERSIIAETQARLKQTEAERDRNWRELKELQASTAVRSAEKDARIAELKKTVLAQNKSLETQRKELARVKKAASKAADTAQRRLDAQKQRVADTREKYQARLDEAKREARESVRAVKEQAKQDLREADDRRKDELKAKTEQGKRKELREKIQKKANTFRQMALAPQKANTLHAPVALTGALYEFCDIFATGQESAAVTAYNANEQREAAMEMLNEARGVTKGRQAEAEVINRQRERLLKKQQALAKIRAEYAALKGTVQEVFHDPHVEMLLTELTDELSQKDIPDMNSTELKAVYDTMKAFEYTIVNANKVFMAGKDKTLFGMVDALREQIGNNKVIGNALNVALRRYSMWQMSPDTFFSYICGYAPNNEGKVVQAMFQRGSERSMGVQRDFWKEFREFTEAEDKATKKAMKEMLGDPTKNMVDWGLKNANGEPVKTSVGMMLQAYMLLTQADSYESLLYGGFKIANAKTYYKGKTVEAFGDAEPNELLSASISEEAESISQQMDEAKRIIRDKEASDEAKKAAQERLTELEQEAQKLIDGEMGRLDEMRKAIQKEIDAHPLYQKLIDAARGWYEHSGELLASVYEDMYGYRPNLVEHYTPIHRDLTNVNVDIRTDVDAAFNLENAGLTKERVKSRAPILLTDFFAELSQHTANISRYYGFAQVQHDFNRIWNVKIPGTRGGTIKALVAGKYGTGNTKLGVSGEKYVENYIKSVAGASRDGDLLSAFYGNAASATLSLNPRVAFSQLASIPTAAGEVGWGSMARGFGKAFGKSFSTSYKVDLSEESIWYWNRYRGAGGSTELSDLEMKGTFWAKIAKTKVGKALFNWCQAFDTYATASMWAMAEDYVQNHGMNVSDEGYKAAVEAKYADIIRHTQPNYTVTERSDLLRDKRGGMKLLTMYKTQSNQNLNILMNAIGEWRATKAALGKKVDGVTIADKKAADARLANGITSVLLGGTAVFVMLRTLVNFAMHNVKSYRDDDDDEVTFKQTLAAMLKEFGSSIAGMFALGGQAYDAVLAIISGENYYGISDSAVGLLADALDNTVAAAQALFSGTGSGKVYKKEIHSLASLLGIPAKNAEKFYTGLLGWYDDIKAKEWFATTDATTKQLRTQLFNAWKNGDDEKFDSVMAVLAAKSSKEKDEDVHKDVVNGFANYYLKDLFTTGKVSRADAVKILEKMNDLPPEDTWADELVNKWEFKMNNPGTELSDAAIKKWYEMDGTIPAAEFEKIYTDLSHMTGDKDKNGKTISGSLKKKYVEYITGLNLTAKQKEALWNAVKGNWTDKDTPWDKGK